MEHSLSLDAFADIDGELDTVVAERAGGGGAVDWGAAVAAKDGRRILRRGLEGDGAVVQVHGHGGRRLGITEAGSRRIESGWTGRGEEGGVRESQDLPHEFLGNSLGIVSRRSRCEKMPYR